VENKQIKYRSWILIPNTVPRTIPVSSSSKRRKAFSISSRESLSLIFEVIISRKSEKSMVPDPSLSISEREEREGGRRKE
jgi:hypothetical protein